MHENMDLTVEEIAALNKRVEDRLKLIDGRTWFENEEVIEAIKIKAACFTGPREHRISYDTTQLSQLKKTVFRIVRTLNEQAEVQTFLYGMATGFDTWAGQVVADYHTIINGEKGEHYPKLNLIGYMPHEEFCANWKISQQEAYSDLALKSDKVIRMQRHYTKDCYQVRNKAMVNHSRFVVALLDSENPMPGGTRNTVVYAKQQGRTIIYIHPETMKITVTYGNDEDKNLFKRDGGAN